MITVHTAAAIVTGVGVCIIEELAATPESHGEPARIVYMTPGQVAYDGCDCGQLALTIVDDYPSNTFPTDGSLAPATGGCAVGPLAYQVLASLTWCVPGMTGNPPQAPTPAKLLESALQFEADAFAMRSAIECCLSTMKKERPSRLFDWRVGRATRVGPEGNCAGVEIIFFFQLM